jgi:hypothetical protein
MSCWISIINCPQTKPEHTMAYKWTKASRAKLSRSQKARWKERKRQQQPKRLKRPSREIWTKRYARQRQCVDQPMGEYAAMRLIANRASQSAGSSQNPICLRSSRGDRRYQLARPDATACSAASNGSGPSMMRSNNPLPERLVALLKELEGRRHRVPGKSCRSRLPPYP